MMKLRPSLHLRSFTLGLTASMAALSSTAFAAQITQSTVADGSHQSWNNSTIWGGSAPTSGNTYVTSPTATGAYTAAANNLGTTTTSRVRDDGTSEPFAGDSLTIVADTELLMKQTGGATSNGNVILDGGSVRYSPNSGSTAVLAGTLQVASTSYLGVAQTATTSLTINSTVTGSTLLHIVGGWANPTGVGTSSVVMTIAFGGDLSGFTGTFDLGGGTNNGGATTGVTTLLDFNQDYNLSLAGLSMATHGTTDQLNLDQNLTFGSLTYNATTIAAGTYSASELNTLVGTSAFIDTLGTHTLTVVPEPNNLALAIVGLLGVMVFIHRRNLRA